MTIYRRGSGFIRNTRATGGGTKVRRTPYLFYVILIAFGVASGFVFGKIVSTGVYSFFSIFIDPKTCMLLLSIVGALVGAFGAHCCEEAYMCANNAIPWLFGGFAVLLIPFLLTIAICIIALLALLVVGIFLGGVMTIIGAIVATILFAAAISLAWKFFKAMIKSIFW